MTLEYNHSATPGLEHVKAPRFGTPRCDEEEGSVGPIVPKDLRSWVTEAELAALVDQVVQELSRNTPGPRTRSWSILLGLLTYSYATGSCLSDEIERSLYEKSQFAPYVTPTFGHSQPSAVLRGFRRANRAAIERALAQVFAAAYSGLRKSADPGFTVFAGRLPDFSAEANARVLSAIQSDSWAMDC